MNKFIFANQLRGFAALAVLISHWFGVYWGMRDIVGVYTLSPTQTGASSIALDFVSFPHFSFGPFGVALFFLISGFVIPFTIEKNRMGRFLFSRFMRVWPTYCVSLLISLSVVWLSGQFWGKPFTWNLQVILSNIFLIFNYVPGTPTVDLVNWTLAVEIKFYIIAALFATVIRKGQTAPLFVYSLLVLIFNWKLDVFRNAMDHPGLDNALTNLSTELMYVSFMWIGTFFCYAVQSKISPVKLMLYTILQLLIFSATWKYSALANQFPIVTENYHYGLIVFTLAFCFRSRFKPIAWIDRLADISYPLYVLHSLIGYSVIKILMYYGLTFFIAALIALLLVIGIAQLVHVFVELPSTALGKNFARPQRVKMVAIQ